MIPTIYNMKPVAKDGEKILFADAKRENGILYNETSNTRSEKMPLQVFFKWGNFVAFEED